MTVETRRYTTLHKIDIVREVAGLIDERVDLENPNKILRVEIIGKYAGISILKPYEIFSAVKTASGDLSLGMKRPGAVVGSNLRLEPRPGPLILSSVWQNESSG